MITKPAKIFISHSSKDVKYVAKIVNLLDGMGLNQTQVFCSSLPGYGIPIDTDTDIFDYLRDQFLKYNLHVIFVHSDNYYRSPVSLNEMGAAWALKSAFTSILLPGFGCNEMKGVVNNQKVSIKLDGEELELRDKLNQLYGKIIDEFGLTRKADIIWEQKRDAFINEVRQVNDDVSNSKLSQDAERLLNKAASDTHGQILKITDLSVGTSKSATTSSTGGLLLALQRANITARPAGRCRKLCYWSAYKAVLLESSFLDSSACSFIYFCTASSVILPIVST